MAAFKGLLSKKEALKDELSKLKAELEALKSGSTPESAAAGGTVGKLKANNRTNHNGTNSHYS